MTRDEEIGVLAGLLDFYSDKSNTHASFVVVGVFGMYALLVFYGAMPIWGFLISYIALLLIEIYAFMNFSYYGAYAHCIAQKLTIGTNLDITPAEREGMGWFVRNYLAFRNEIVKLKLQYPILVSLWFSAAIVPLIFRVFQP